MNRMNYADVFSIYNNIVTLLKGLSDPQDLQNHTSVVTINRWQNFNLNKDEETIIKDTLLSGLNKKIVAPYVFEINYKKFYIIFSADDKQSFIESYINYSLFKDISDQVFIYINNKDNFIFQPSEKYSTIEDMLNIYIHLFEALYYLNQDNESYRNSIRNKRLYTFLFVLFIKTNTSISDKDIEKTIGPDRSFLISKINDLIKNDNIVNDYGFINKENYNLANNINLICNINNVEINVN